MNATLEHLWSEFSDKLGGFIRSKINDPATAEDIRQDVFLKLRRHMSKKGTITDMEAWLYRSARNAIIDHYRTRKQTIELSDSLPEDRLQGPPDLQELMASFRRMIHSLPDSYREAIILADLEGLPQEDVARKLKLTLSATKSRILRGRSLLKKMLNECCSFEFDRRGSVIDCSPRRKRACDECGS